MIDDADRLCLICGESMPPWSDKDICFRHRCLNETEPLTVAGPVSGRGTEGREGLTCTASPVQLSALVDRFLRWPLPKTVRADLCVTMDYPHPRTGTNLLTADEARQMFEYLTSTPLPPDSALSLLDRLRLKDGMAFSDPYLFKDAADFVESASSRLLGLLYEVERLEKVNRRTLDTLQWIAAQSDLFFAECAQAEEIVQRVNAAIKQAGG